MKTTKYLTQLISMNEGIDLEFKVHFDLGEITKIACSFLNTSGGQIVVGLKDKTKVLGVVDAKNKEQELKEYLIQQIVPDSVISVSTEVFQDKELILVKVLEGQNKPYVYNGTIFYRYDDGSKNASKNEVINLIDSRKLSDRRWEREPLLNAEIDDLDTAIIISTMEQINKVGRTQQVSNNIIDFLTRFNLYRNGNLTNAACLLFAKEPTRFISQSTSRIIVLERGKTDSKILNDKLFEKDLFSNLEYIMKFIKSNVGVSSEFEGNNWQRADYNYPNDALREAFINALIHRDYSNYSSNLLITIFPDRIEIMNHGQLPDDIKVADLKKNHLSQPRNPDIAQMVFLRGWIEKIGRGTLKIIDECKKVGLTEPRWTSNSGVTTLTIFKYPEKMKRKEFVDLNERQRKIISQLDPGEIINLKDYSELVEAAVSDRSLRTDLVGLISGGWFKKQGRGKNTKYLRTEK